MSWEQPSYAEITMNSEIGAYQDEFSGVERGHAQPAPNSHDAVAAPLVRDHPPVAD